MQDSVASARSANPPIHLVESDYDLIAELALGLEHRSPELAKMLLDEIDRAEICAPGKLPRGVVAIGSEVEFLDEAAGTTRTVRLVHPADADLDNGCVSILTPIGAGLIGLRKGQSINWPASGGKPRVLKILNVTRPTAP